VLDYKNITINPPPTLEFGAVLGTLIY